MKQPAPVNFARSLTVLVGVALTTGCAARNSSVTNASHDSPTAIPQSDRRISVRFVGLDSKRGDGPVQVALWDSAASFMRDGLWVAGVSVPVGEAEKGVVFENLPPGRYAVSAFHDTRNVGRLRQGAFGIPIDPWAISNAGASIGPPTWQRASFDLLEVETVVELDFQHRPRPVP